MMFSDEPREQTPKFVRMVLCCSRRTAISTALYVAVAVSTVAVAIAVAVAVAAAAAAAAISQENIRFQWAELAFFAVAGVFVPLVPQGLVGLVHCPVAAGVTELWRKHVNTFHGTHLCVNKETS
jgi:hypothetical protein